MSDATKTARDEFEKWCMRENGKWGKKVIERHSDGRYCVLQTYMDWTAWQAGYFSAISTLKAQRDELLAAAKNAALDLRGTPDGIALEAAIANAEKTTP